MLNKKLRILNFDNSIINQKALFSRYETEIVDLVDLGPWARHWMSGTTRSLIQQRIADSSKGSITFLGSGDFHHISEILISQFNEPLSVISFDFHPDWATLPPRFGCGSWVSEVLKKRNILKLVLFGASSADISDSGIRDGNLDSLADDRVEIYPYAHGPTKVFFKKIPKNVSVTVEEENFFKRIYWHEIKNSDPVGLLEGLLGRVPTKKVYVSIDKDCLSCGFALTNWEEGMMSLNELLLMLRIIKENKEIAGLDITGDYSPISVKGIIRRLTSYLDHPRQIKTRALPESEINSVNENTNLKILELFSS